MIAVRNVFNLKFGRAKEAKALMKEAVEINRKNGLKDVRVFSDLTGQSYRLIFETYHESLVNSNQNFRPSSATPIGEQCTKN